MYLTKNLVNQICFDIIFKQGPPPDLITETSTSSTTPTTPDPTTTHTTAALSSNQEPKIIIGVSVSVFGLISLLATVGFVSKLIKYKYEYVFFTLYTPSLNQKEKKMNKSPKNEIYNVFHF